MAGRALAALLTPLLVLGGAYAIVRAGGLLLRSSYHFSFAQTLTFSVPQSRVPALAAGVAALVVGVVLAFTLARFLKWLPVVRGLIVLLQAAVLALLIVALVATKTY